VSTCVLEKHGHFPGLQSIILPFEFFVCKREREFDTVACLQAKNIRSAQVKFSCPALKIQGVGAMEFCRGIVGLSNVGELTIFNAFTAAGTGVLRGQGRWLPMVIRFSFTLMCRGNIFRRRKDRDAEEMLR
jgi:hypothetical protein